MPQPDKPESADRTSGPRSGTQGNNVECYSGHTYAQEPRAVIWQGERLPVRGIEALWRTPAGPAFRVRTGSGARFALQ